MVSVTDDEENKGTKHLFKFIVLRALIRFIGVITAAKQ